MNVILHTNVSLFCGLQTQTTVARFHVGFAAVQP